jgi:hypothetical protein
MAPTDTIVISSLHHEANNHQGQEVHSNGTEDGGPVQCIFIPCKAYISLGCSSSTMGQEKACDRCESQQARVVARPETNSTSWLVCISCSPAVNATKRPRPFEVLF